MVFKSAVRNFHSSSNDFLAQHVLLRTQSTKTTSDGRISFWCFGCGEVHAVPTDRWSWNGNYEQPSLTPSLLTTYGHYCDHWKQGDSCWCTYNAEHPDPAPFVCVR